MRPPPEERDGLRAKVGDHVGRRERAADADHDPSVSAVHRDEEDGHEQGGVPVPEDNAGALARPVHSPGELLLPHLEPEAEPRVGVHPAGEPPRNLGDDFLPHGRQAVQALQGPAIGSGGEPPGAPEFCEPPPAGKPAPGPSAPASRAATK